MGLAVHSFLFISGKIVMWSGGFVVGGCSARSVRLLWTIFASPPRSGTLVRHMPSKI